MSELSQLSYFILTLTLFTENKNYDEGSFNVRSANSSNNIKLSILSRGPKIRVFSYSWEVISILVLKGWRGSYAGSSRSTLGLVEPWHAPERGYNNKESLEINQ